MSVFIKDIPILKGKNAERFIKMTQENFNKRGSIDFSKEFANSYAILMKCKK